ncbi:MAG: hypothetical protein ACREPM_09960 [Gemmatimonadaceae bacterium]
MLVIVAAVLGSLLFFGAALLYFAGNRLNAEVSNSLAIYCLALILDDAFRDAIATGVRRAAAEARSTGLAPEPLSYRLMSAATDNAKRYYQADPAVSTMAVVVEALRRFPTRADE